MSARIGFSELGNSLWRVGQLAVTTWATRRDDLGDSPRRLGRLATEGSGKGYKKIHPTRGCESGGFPSEGRACDPPPHTRLHRRVLLLFIV